MWTKRFSQGPDILGKTFVLNGVLTTLVGIMPLRFTKRGAALWRPVALDRSDPETSQRYILFQGRLKPGVTQRDVETDITVIAIRLSQVDPKTIRSSFRFSPSLSIAWWEVSQDAVHAGGRGGAAPADSLRQRGQHAARAGQGPGLSFGEQLYLIGADLFRSKLIRSAMKA